MLPQFRGPGPTFGIYLLTVQGRGRGADLRQAQAHSHLKALPRPSDGQLADDLLATQDVIPRDARAHLLRLALVLTLAGLGVPVARGAPRVETVLRHLEVPWALAFAPDGRLFFTERPGRLRVVTDGKLAVEPVAQLPVSASGEGGLMGLAVDPDFARTHHLYVCYTAAKRGGSVNRISRLTLNAGRAGDERVLLDDMPGAGIHDGCRLKFGPDGKLYATMGDAGQSPRAQRRDSLSGKILRIDADGSVPGDNPVRGSPVL